MDVVVASCDGGAAATFMDLAHGTGVVVMLSNFGYCCTPDTKCCDSV